MRDFLGSATELVREGGVGSGTFPHLCPFSPKGASKEFCREQTGNIQRNGSGCCASKCTSELRKCFLCLSSGRRGSDVKYVDDPLTGCCREHAEGAPKASALPQRHSPQARGVQVQPPRQNSGSAQAPPAKPAAPTALAARAAQPAAPEAQKPNADMGKAASDAHKRDDSSLGPMLGRKADAPLPKLGRPAASDDPWKEILARVRRALANAKPVELPPQRFRPMPDQPREWFDPEELGLLEESMVEVGQIQYGLARTTIIDARGADHEVLDGERRWRCAIHAPLPFYRAMVLDIDDEAAPYVIAAISNFNRSEHTAMEKSNAIERLHNGPLKVPMDSIAATIGVSLHTAYKLHTLQTLPQEVKNALDPRLQKRGRGLPLQAAFEIARLKDPVFDEYAKDFARRVQGKEMKLTRVRAEVDRILIRSGRANTMTQQRHEPARRWGKVESHVFHAHDDLSAVLEETREILAEKVPLPKSRDTLTATLKGIIRDANAVLELFGEPTISQAKDR